MRSIHTLAVLRFLGMMSVYAHDVFTIKSMKHTLCLFQEMIGRCW